MQSRILQTDYFGVPNHDDWSEELYNRYVSAAQAGRAMGNDGRPSPVDTETNEPILVKALFLRVGQIAGEVPPGFIEADLCFCDSQGQIINDMTRSVSVPITEDLRPLVDRFKMGQSTAEDDNTIARAILDSPQAYALGV